MDPSAGDAELETALQAIRGVRANMDGLRWWLCQSESGRELDNQIWRALSAVPDNEDEGD